MYLEFTRKYSAAFKRTAVLASLASFVFAGFAHAQDATDLDVGADKKKAEKKAGLVEETKPAVEPPKKKKDDDKLKKGEFDYEKIESLGFTRKEQELQLEKSKTRKALIKTLEDYLNRGTITDPNKLADIYFRLAEAWWEETHYLYLLDRAEYNKLMLSFDKGILKVAPIEPVENYQKSISFYEKILQQAPNYQRMDEVLYRLGKAALQQGKALGDKVLSNKGVQYLNQLVQKHQTSKYIAQTRLALAEHFFEMNNLTLAKMNYEQIVQNHKCISIYNYALYKLGWVYFNLREFRRTIETFQMVIKEVGSDSCGKKEEMNASKMGFIDQACKDLDQAYAELEHGWDEAERYFSETKTCGTVEAHLIRIKDLYVANDKDELAIEILHKFIKEQPTDKRCVDWHEQIIDIRKKIGNFKDTEVAMRDFLSFSDSRTSAWVAANKNNAEVADKADKMGEAILLFVANYYHQLAQKTDEETKTFEKAKPYYAQAAADYGEFERRYPKAKKRYIVSFYHAEILFDQLKDYKGAKERYLVVIDLDPEGEYVEDAALGVIYSVEELMKQTRACYNEQKDAWDEGPTCPYLLDPNTSSETKVFKTKKKEDLTESQIKAAIVPKKAQKLHPLETDYVKGADTYVKLMESLKEKKKLAGKGTRVPEIMYLAATAFYERGQYDQAIKRLEQTYNFKEDSKAAEIAVKTLIDIYARQKEWAPIELWARKMLARKTLIVFQKKDLRKYVAVAMAEQAILLAEKKDWDGAHAKYDKILAEYKAEEPELAATSLYNKALLYELQKEDTKAISTYERVVKEFPKAKIAPEAMFNIGVIYESMTNFKDAADAFLNMTKFRDNADAAQALINAAAILNALGDYKGAAAAYDAFVKLANALKGDDENTQRLKSLVADAELEKGHVLEKMGADGAKAAAGVYGALVTKYPNRPDLAVEALGRRAETLRLSDAGKNRVAVYKTVTDAVKAYENPAGQKGRAAYYVAQGMFYKAEYDFDDFEAVTLKTVKKMSQLAGVLVKKADLLKKSEKSYFGVIDQTASGQGRAYAAASAFRIGLLYFNFKEDLFKAPIPPQVLSNPQLEEEYRKAIELIAVPIEEQALSALKNAINVAHNMGVYNKWSKEAGEYAARVSAADYPTVEKDPNLPRASTAVSPDKPTDAATSASFVTSVRRGKYKVSFKPEVVEIKKAVEKKADEKKADTPPAK